MKFKKIAIANRGEVAVRIIRACQELGIKTVLLHSEPDTQSLAWRLADERFCIGPAPTSESYLNIDANIQAALKAGADAIHPGFGFLSENETFARECAKYKLVFIGPSPESIRSMGDKVEAKEIARKSMVPVIPGYEGEMSQAQQVLEAARNIGFPVIVKAAGGGGGRGLKVARSDEELQDALESAQREAQSSFGSSRVFIEKYFERAKHIEVQIFGDSRGVVHALGERECSVQRRHQKIVEEAPSSILTPDVRKRIEETAVRLATAVGYRGAGTVEFLLQDQQFFFMEMNTRLQVEHPVTELVFNVDLVKSQILTAQGDLVSFDLQPHPRGHAIECRIYAEDAYAGGRPSTGLLVGLRWPQGMGRRFEVGFEVGDSITSFYDPMIAKIIVWDENRERAIRKMLRVLDETIIFGVKTNIPLLKAILQHSDFVSGAYTTQFMGQHFAEGLVEPVVETWEQDLLEKVKRESLGRGTAPASSGLETASLSVWSGSWRNS